LIASIVVGFEREPARLKTVGNLDLANGAALSRQLSRDPDRFQHAEARCRTRRFDALTDT